MSSVDETGNPEEPQDEAQGEKTENTRDGTRSEADGTDNPLASVDPESLSVAGRSSGQSLENDPSDDPLWNPALEPDPELDPRGGQSANPEDGPEPEDDDRG